MCSSNKAHLKYSILRDCEKPLTDAQFFSVIQNSWLSFMGSEPCALEFFRNCCFSGLPSQFGSLIGDKQLDAVICPIFYVFDIRFGGFRNQWTTPKERNFFLLPCSSLTESSIVSGFFICALRLPFRGSLLTPIHLMNESCPLHE